MELPSLGNQCYFCVLVDDKTGYLWFYPCLAKSDFTPWFIKMDSFFMNHYQSHTKILRSDQGGEYINMALEDYCSRNSITMEFMVSHTPEQNRVTEHATQKILDKGCTIMKDANAPDFLWVDAFTTVMCVINRTAGGQTGSVTPFKAFFGEKPDISHMWVWYANVFIHQLKGLGAGKLGECGHQVKFLGYPENSAGYRTYDPCTHKAQVAHAPIFREEARPTLLSSFKSTVGNSDIESDPNNVPQNSDSVPPADSGTTLSPPPLTLVHPPTPPSAPSPPPGHPVWERWALHHLNPSEFGPHGH